MNTRKAFITLGLLLAFVMMLSSARASERDQATEITFSQSVQIPGRVLPAGTYRFVVSDGNTSRNIVQIFNSDRSVLYATVLTINTESLTTTDKTTITFAEREPMQPQTILSWFYPGRTIRILQQGTAGTCAGQALHHNGQSTEQTPDCSGWGLKNEASNFYLQGAGGGEMPPPARYFALR
jgi:hypothetical protein